MSKLINSFHKKVILITGASSDIGMATALQFAKLKGRLALSGRNEENLNDLAWKCQESGGEPPLILKADMNCEHIIRATTENFKSLDVLVNNNGIFEEGSIETTTLPQYDTIFSSNVRSVYNLTMLAVPHLIKSKGNIINVSSVHGIRPATGKLAYSMSKAALDQFTKCVALELAIKGVRVNSVNPGLRFTNLHKQGKAEEETYQEYVQRSRETFTLGRTKLADEVAEAIIFLASDSASFITGCLLPIDGSRHVMVP